METVEHDFAPLGVRFYYIYKALAHLEHNGYVNPASLEERLLHIKEAQRTLGSRIPWICDSMENTLKHGLGNAPNSEFIINAQGKVMQRRAWSDPEALRVDLEQLVGIPNSHTRIEDLNLRTSPPPETVAKGLVPRIKPPSANMQPVRVNPLSTNKDQPFFVKLRAESTPELLQNGKGKLYLGFFMDPLHHVHWNNLTEPLNYTLELPNGIRTESLTGKAPSVNHPADADPREFLIDMKITSSENHSPFIVTINYFACDNNNTFCVPVKQVFEVFLERDRDAGRTMRSKNRRQRGLSEQRPNNRNRYFGNRTPPSFHVLDVNQDGILNFNELEKLPQLLNDLDLDQNGRISRSEFRSIHLR